MSKSELQNKVWYRAIKVAFVALFLVAQILTLQISADIGNTKAPNPAVDIWIGLHGNPINYYNDKEFLAQHPIPPAFVQTYSWRVKISIYLIDFAIVTLGFFILMRVFFYIILGEPIFWRKQRHDKK